MRINQPEKSGPRPGVLVLLIALALVLMTVWYREGDHGPIHRTRAAIAVVTTPLGRAGEFLTRPARGFFAWAGDLGVSRSQLEELRTQNESLRTRVAELEEERLENKRLKDLLAIAQQSELESVGARVIGRTSNSWEGVITIDRGSQHGVSNGMPVVGPDGLLGQTVEVAANSAKVRLITDQRSGVAAMIQSSRATGIARGTIDGSMMLDFVSRDTTVTAGDVIITSGLGGVYPKGLVIGEVTRVDRDPSALYQRIAMAPSGAIGALEEVLVLVAVPETDPLSGGE